MFLKNIPNIIWRKRMLKLAREIASWSKEKHKVGCVITDKNSIILGTGYNGPPRGIENETSIPVHAEMNAIMTMNRMAKADSIYIWPYCPCQYCAGLIIQTGIKQVVFSTAEEVLSSWSTGQVKAIEMLTEAKIICEKINLEEV